MFLYFTIKTFQCFLPILETYGDNNLLFYWIIIKCCHRPLSLTYYLPCSYFIIRSQNRKNRKEAGKMFNRKQKMEPNGPILSEHRILTLVQLSLYNLKWFLTETCWVYNYSNTGSLKCLTTGQQLSQSVLGVGPVDIFSLCEMWDVRREQRRNDHVVILSISIITSTLIIKSLFFKFRTKNCKMTRRFSGDRGKNLEAWNQTCVPADRTLGTRKQMSVSTKAKMENTIRLRAIIVYGHLL